MMRLEIEYATLWGESLAVESSTGVRYPLQWAGNNIWAADFKRFPRKEFSSYEYLLLRDGIVERCEWDVHHLPENFRGSVKRDSWIEAPAGAGPFIRKHLNPRFDAAGFRGAGTVIPVFSLRSESSFGIGEFSDLKLLADWAAATGQCILQLLPVNDTTRKGDWADSYPYSPVSSFALHPLYIRLQDVGVEETPEFLRVKEELEALPELDYPRVFSTKMAFLRAAFSAKGKTDVQSAAFRDFCARNAFWLDEYAAFCAKRDGVEADFHRWLQFHLDRQFSGAVAYAREKGVCFKGDLPIGVSADSADACFHPELFNLDSTAGAPPDFFSEHGQNWGFPTYNWEKMAEDNYSWWKRRLRKMAEYFDAYRIDHILGFFRIWEIPVKEKSGTEGHFNPSLPYTRKEIEALGLWGRKGLFLEDPRHPGRYVPRIRPASETLPEGLQRTFGALYDDFFFHRHDQFWERNAMLKLPELLRSSGMLACGEDLGMIPACVPGVMQKLGILSLEMPMMDKGRPWPQLSVCTTSSHDMDTLRMQNGESDLPAWECRNRIQGVLDSSSMLAILPLQDWLSIDGEHRRRDYKEERINQPADPHHHWRYRMHLTLEELKSMSGFNAALEGLLKDSRRYC